MRLHETRRPSLKTPTTLRFPSLCKLGHLGAQIKTNNQNCPSQDWPRCTWIFHNDLEPFLGSSKVNLQTIKLSTICPPVGGRCVSELPFWWDTLDELNPTSFEICWDKHKTPTKMGQYPCQPNWVQDFFHQHYVSWSVARHKTSTWDHNTVGNVGTYGKQLWTKTDHTMMVDMVDFLVDLPHWYSENKLVRLPLAIWDGKDPGLVESVDLRDSEGSSCGGEKQTTWHISWIFTVHDMYRILNMLECLKRVQEVETSLQQTLYIYISRNHYIKTTHLEMLRFHNIYLHNVYRM